MGKAKLFAALLLFVAACGPWLPAAGVAVEDFTPADQIDLLATGLHGAAKLMRREKFEHDEASRLELLGSQEGVEEDPEAEEEKTDEEEDAIASGTKALVQQTDLVRYVYRSLRPVGWLPQIQAQISRKPPVAPPLEQVCLVSNEKSNPKNFLMSSTFHEQVQEGRRLVMGKRIIFTGLWRDIGAQAAAQMFDALSALGSYFRDYQLIMLENDSADDTRQGIQNKCASADRAWCFLLDNVGKRVLHAGAPNRIVGLTALRQTLLMKVREFDKAGIFDYVMMIDGDIYAHGNGGFNIAGTLAAFTLTLPDKLNADAVCAYQVAGRSATYYDSFAHIGPPCSYSDLEGAPSCPASSCGGGMVFYSMAQLRESQCNYVYVNEETCEHKPFNSCLAKHNHSRLFIFKPWSIAMFAPEIGGRADWNCSPL